MTAKHTHSWICTREICGVGPSRDELVRKTLLRRLERGEEFLHYKRSEVEIMRLALASSGVVSSPHSDPREGSLGASAADPDETSPVSASAPSLSPSEAVSAPPSQPALPHAPTARAHQSRGVAR